MEELEGYREFVTEICKKRGPKGPFKVRNSWGVYDCYKHIRKNGWYNIGRKVLEHEFYTIVRSMNKLYAEELLHGRDIKLPYWMGSLGLRRLAKGVSIVDGQLKIDYPVNWPETYKLWYSDAEAMKNKVLLRHETPYVFKVRYGKKDAQYENKVFYGFAVTREIKKALKEKIDQGKIDTVW